MSGFPLRIVLHASLLERGQGVEEMNACDKSSWCSHTHTHTPILCDPPNYSAVNSPCMIWPTLPNTGRIFAARKRFSKALLLYQGNFKDGSPRCMPSAAVTYHTLLVAKSHVRKLN